MLDFALERATSALKLPHGKLQEADFMMDTNVISKTGKLVIRCEMDGGRQ